MCCGGMADEMKGLRGYSTTEMFPTRIIDGAALAGLPYAFV